MATVRFEHHPHRKLSNVLLRAYAPCPHFGSCPQATWDPTHGQVPRGFLGATGALSDVEVIMLFAEPGHPYAQEDFDPDKTPNETLESAVSRTYKHYRDGTDLFHRNVRWFLSELYPDMPFDQQLKRAWLTEGRLCSIENEIGSTRNGLCAQYYLARQIEILPNATVVAFGDKARYYMKKLAVECLEAYAFAPPGANFPPTRPSWEKAISTIIRRR